MRTASIWHRMKPVVKERGYAREAYDRQGNGEKLVQLATSDGFVAEMRGGFVHVATSHVVNRSHQMAEQAKRTNASVFLIMLESHSPYAF